MCGIFGLCGEQAGEPASLGVLQAMGDSLIHRGPDEGGVRTEPGLGFGMRRLSIIDLASGHQPLANEDGSVWVVFNGEIYNYRELTADLVSRGHRFATASDTETVVHLYEDYGADCVKHLRGMFAFALWDARKQTLLLARDRLGIKPLYYAETPQGLVFGSELRAVISSPWVKRRIDPRALAAYLTFGYVPDPLSILEGVSKLAPGHVLLVTKGRAGAPQRYWEPTSHFNSSDEPLGVAEAGERLWSHLESAVRSHLVSDVPVGAFLSGGMDSSTVVGIMAREAGVPVKTFSVGFGEKQFDEAPYARRVAQWFGTEHHELIATPQDLGLLEDVLAACDEPFADASAIPTYLVSRLARQHVKVVLSGDGGDELFAGYDRYVVDRRERPLGSPGRPGAGGAPQASEQRVARGDARQELPPPLLHAPDGALPRRDLALLGRGPRRSPGARSRLRAAAPLRGGPARQPGAGSALAPPGPGSPHLPARRHPDQGRPDEHGALRGSARAAPRSPAGRVRVPLAAGASHAGRRRPSSS